MIFLFISYLPENENTNADQTEENEAECQNIKPQVQHQNSSVTPKQESHMPDSNFKGKF